MALLGAAAFASRLRAWCFGYTCGESLDSMGLVWFFGENGYGNWLRCLFTSATIAHDSTDL